MYTDTTQYYGLPVFLGNDKAVWQDINTGNEKVDAALHDLQVALTAAEGVGNGNTQVITTLQAALKQAEDLINQQGVNIAQAQADILTNAGNITKLQGDYNTLNADVTSLENRTQDAENGIIELESTTATNTSNIVSLQNKSIKKIDKILLSGEPYAIAEFDELGMVEGEIKTFIVGWRTSILIKNETKHFAGTFVVTLNKNYGVRYESGLFAEGNTVEKIGSMIASTMNQGISLRANIGSFEGTNLNKNDVYFTIIKTGV